jgi:hypothetical protein
MVFASSMDFLDLWPRSSADLPADVFIGNHYRAAFTESGDGLVMNVRHVLRPSAGRAQARLSITLAQECAPEKVASLQDALARWPA